VVVQVLVALELEPAALVVPVLVARVQAVLVAVATAATAVAALVAAAVATASVNSYIQIGFENARIAAGFFVYRFMVLDTLYTNDYREVRGARTNVAA
jgi:hypothetical protein